MRPYDSVALRQHNREKIEAMEKQAEGIYQSLQDSQTVIRKQASQCLKTSKAFSEKRKRIQSALNESKEQGKNLNDKLDRIEDKL